MYPVFGSENRISRLSGPAMMSLEAASISLPTYYKVDTTANLDEVATAMLNEGIVAGAYVKPPAEPPVMRDQVVTPPGQQEAPPTSPDFRARQNYQDPAPGGIDARFAWTQAGGKGGGVRIIDVEGAWRFTHEDLMVNQGGVIGGTPSADLGWINHGTAVAGVFGRRKRRWHHRHLPRSQYQGYLYLRNRHDVFHCHSASGRCAGGGRYYPD